MFILSPRRKFIFVVVAMATWLVVAPRAEATIDATLQMQLGNPSGATNDPNNHNHYLIQRSVEAIDYSDSLGEPVWVSWDLTGSDIGGSGRSPDFFTDTNLPPGFYEVTTDDYNGVGNINFTRGHMCPSEDRTDNVTDNDLVFFMSNIVPQSAADNEGPWGTLESYCQSSAQAGNEILITCGPSGFSTNTIPSGKAYIGAYTWKIAVIVPPGAGMAASRVTNNTQVIAIKIPNTTTVSGSYTNYLTTVSQIETDTGFAFFTALPSSVAYALGSRAGGHTNTAPVIAGFSPTNGAAGANVIITGSNFTAASAVAFNGASASFTVNLATQITATVPTNATTGLISVTTSNGAGFSANNFFVTGSGIGPSFTLQPQSLTINAGQNAAFAAVASGTAPVSYQWYFAGNLITNATGTNYTVVNAEVSDAGNYQVIATNNYGTATSSVATLTVLTTTGNSSNIVAQWNFNDTTANVTNPPPSYGAGTVALVGGTTSAFVSGTGSTDTASPNNSWNTTTYGTATTGDETRGARFNVSTVGYQNLSVSWDERLSNTASKYYQLQYTIDGTNFLNAGLVTMNAALVFESKTNSLSGFAGVNNNPNFAFRIVAEFESTAIGTANAAYVTASGSTFGSAGTARFDMMTLYGTPIATNTPPPALSAVNNSGGQFHFTVTGAAGGNYVIQASTNLSAWLPILTNVSPFTFTETNSFPARFYRAVSLP